MVTIHAENALTADGWRDDVRITLADGQIASISSSERPHPGDERHRLVIPGMPNLHSHAFQRAMAGLAETRGSGRDSFWSWRDVMYRFALAITPDELEAIATQLYIEMLEAGFTRVGEFHYLHNDEAGRHYADAGEMATRIASAAGQAGIGLTLLPVFYAHGDFGNTDPTAAQRRFVTNTDGFARLFEASRRAIAPLPGARLGVAPHSLRAVTPQELPLLAEMAGDAPIHIHVSEQNKEVDDCLAWSGARPVELLFDTVEVDRRWCLVHATHVTDGEMGEIARSGAVAGLCPITEANLGDGIFRAPDLIGRSGEFGIGSDSNVLIGVADELRQLEYSQRLALRSRNVLAPEGGSTGRFLFDAALAGGGKALGAARSALEVGCGADLVALRPGNDLGALSDPDRFLDAWIFSNTVQVDSVWVDGRKHVENGRHLRRDNVRPRFEATMRDLLQAL